MKAALMMKDADVKVFEVLKEMQQNAEDIDSSLANDLIMPLANWNSVLNDNSKKIITQERFETQKARFFDNASFWTKRYYDALEYKAKWDDNNVESTINVIDEYGSEIDTEKVLNPKHKFFSIDFLRTLMSKCDPICRVTGDETGTGWLLPNSYLITNHHVIPSRNALENATFEFNFEVDPLYSKSRPTKYKAKYDSVLVTSPVEELDFSIFQLEETANSEIPIPLAKWKFLELYDGSSFNYGDKVYIIQHPGGKVKQVVLTGNYLTKVEDDRLKYSANTKGGSSGSPVLNEEMKVIALHHAYDKVSSNQGVRVDKIIAYLKNQCGDLGRDVIENIII